MTEDFLKTPVKVLFVDHAEQLGGAEYSLLGLTGCFDRARVEPFLCCPEGDLFQAAVGQNLEVYDVSYPRLRFNPGFLLDLIEVSTKINKLIRQKNIDLIHSNTVRSGLYAAFAARRSGIPLVWHVRDLIPQKWYLKLMCLFSSKVITVSEFVASTLSCKRKIVVIPNGVDPERFSICDQPLRKELGLKSSVPLIGWVGRLRKWKRVHLFLEAASLVLKQHPNVYFVVIGGQIFGNQTEYPEQMRALASQLKIDRNVFFVGHRQDIPEILGSLDILVHTAQQEPFGRIMIEGMAARVPVVAFEDGASAETVEHGKTGYLVPNGSTSLLAQRLSELVESPQVIEKMGEDARNRVLNNFDIRNIAESFERIYKELLEADQHPF